MLCAVMCTCNTKLLAGAFDHVRHLNRVGKEKVALVAKAKAQEILIDCKPDSVVMCRAFNVRLCAAAPIKLGLGS